MKRSEDEEIEKLRLLMQEAASDKDLTDQRVVRLSEKLDRLIYEFYKAETKVHRPAM